MKFRALIPLAISLLLISACWNPCKKGTTTCYRKACPTGVCPTSTYSRTTTTVTEEISQEIPTEIEVAQVPLLTPELEEVVEEAEQGLIKELPKEPAPQRILRGDKETLDDEIIEEI